MILLTDAQRTQLLANGRQPDADHIPVVKFFNPFGAGVWLATELDEDGDIMFGLADIGYPELGSWSFHELRSIRLPFGMGIERDLLFTGDFPISAWADAARETGSIRDAERLLYRPGRPLTRKSSDTETRHS
ncbi:MAG: single-stranded DNA endonuclease [Hyphomonas sp.]|nr:single-stranded DNA endonuclease [Hyphomonas sp.]|tara:strand:+ start:529 stop:924 length:396 start_codon:yes stop_codon:yes gene_type:complete